MSDYSKNNRPQQQCRYCGQVVFVLNSLGYCGERCTESAEGPDWRTKLANRDTENLKGSLWGCAGLLILAVVWYLWLSRK
jgi:hypothetical protein